MTLASSTIASPASPTGKYAPTISAISGNLLLYMTVYTQVN
ncbi:MAG: hypothetical protein WB630_01970 [Candidatus Acidiferrales bacterium]